MRVHSTERAGQMAAVMAMPPPTDVAPASVDDAEGEEGFMSEAQLEEIKFYNALTPTQALPLLAVSGVSLKGHWIGSLPVPPEEEPSEDDDSGDETEEEDRKELLASARPLQPSRSSLTVSDSL